MLSLWNVYKPYSIGFLYGKWEVRVQCSFFIIFEGFYLSKKIYIFSLSTKTKNFSKICLDECLFHHFCQTFSKPFWASSNQGAEDYALIIDFISICFFFSWNADYLHIASPRTVFHVSYIFSYDLVFSISSLCWKRVPPFNLLITDSVFSIFDFDIHF